MSFFCSPEETIKARLQHFCTWCSQDILPGNNYVRWLSIVDGYKSTNKMHPECAKAMHAELSEHHEHEYMPYENERPTE